MSQVVGRREDSSPLLVDNGPPTKDGEDNDDGGLRTVDDDILPSNCTGANLTSVPPTAAASSSALHSPSALHSNSPSTLPPSSSTAEIASSSTPTPRANK